MLDKLGCIEEVEGIMYLTNAGALFFRDDRDDVKFRHAAVVCVRYLGDNKVDIINQSIFDKDMISNIDNALDFLKANLSTRFEIKGVRRKNILELPIEALREALINAVCHRDYFVDGARTMVEIYPSKVEISSPGGLCRGMSAEKFGVKSLTRNQQIASILYRADYIEELGTGIKRMRSETQELGVEEPMFEFDENWFSTIFPRKILDEISENLSEEVRNANRTSIGRQSDSLNLVEKNIL